MKNIKRHLAAFLFMGLAFPYTGTTQNNSTNEPHYEVNTSYAPLSISKEKLNLANSLVDLNENFKASWIEKYISVEISTRKKGKKQKVVTKNNMLSQKQKAIMAMADLGTEIEVKVRYIPKNTLKHNHPKEIDFAFTIIPEKEAQYKGGTALLNQYIKEQAIDKIPAGSFKGFDLVAVKFTIDEAGKVGQVHLFETSKNEPIDKLLIETIQNMPNWEPATYSNGLHTKQEFVLTVGNMENCIVNLLNIRKK